MIDVRKKIAPHSELVVKSLTQLRLSIFRILRGNATECWRVRPHLVWYVQWLIVIAATMFGDASQIGIWDSKKGLIIDQFDISRNATPAQDRNRTRIITTILVSRLSCVVPFW